MSEESKRLETWAQVVLVGLMIIFHAIAVEGRIAKLEQKVDDLTELVRHGK